MNRLKKVTQIYTERSMYHFKDLINEYSRFPVFKIVPGEIEYDYDNGGQPTTSYELKELEFGAIVPLNRNDLNYDEGGTFNNSTRKLYCYEFIPKGSKISYKEQEYTVLSSLDYSDYDIDEESFNGLYIYFVSRGDTDD